mmetsp:Transcript_32432/g.52316  ORF Transcript_32432/g.52316 Transcript_32432/m.52316 type:complete len:211 (-) Transcript_32432:1442-2074(-)
MSNGAGTPLVGHHRPGCQAKDIGRVVPLLRQRRRHVRLGGGPGALGAADEVGLVDDAFGLEPCHGVLVLLGNGITLKEHLDARRLLDPLLHVLALVAAHLLVEQVGATRHLCIDLWLGPEVWHGQHRGTIQEGEQGVQVHEGPLLGDKHLHYPLHWGVFEEEFRQLVGPLLVGPLRDPHQDRFAVRHKDITSFNGDFRVIYEAFIDLDVF